ncbi:hypothetical protein Tco_0934440 [Tanacetum coccineum]
MEHLLGEAYTNENLKTLKSHHITTLSFKTTLENETALTAYMYKVAEISPEPIKSLLPPSGEVNADDSADKSSSRTSVQPVRDVPQKKQVAEIQSAEETVATADATQSLRAFESAEDQVNQPRTADAEKVQEQNVEIKVKSSGPTSHGDVTFEQLMDEYDKKQSAATEESENPYDPEFKIKVYDSEKELSKVLKTKMGSSIRMKVRKGMKEVRDKLHYFTQRVDQASIHVREMDTLIGELVRLLESALFFTKANAEGEK